MIDCSQDQIKGSPTKLETKMRMQFLPKLIGRVSPGGIDRSVLVLPARLGVLNIINPDTDSAQKFKDAERLCKPLVEKLLSSDTGLDGVASGQKLFYTEIQKENERRASTQYSILKSI